MLRQLVQRSRPDSLIPLRRAAGKFLLAVILLGASACAAPSPPGAPFSLASAPGADRARIYIYRVDSVPSGSASVSLKLGDERLGSLRNHEYLTLTVRPGKHILSTRFQSLLSGTRSDVPITASPGITYYVHLFADSQENQRAPGFGREIYSVGLFASMRPVLEARKHLERCTLQPADAPEEPAETSRAQGTKTQS